MRKGFLQSMDITREANINRGTFYLHDVDKFDLLERFEKTAFKNQCNHKGEFS